MELIETYGPVFYSANFGTDEPVRPYPYELKPQGTTVLITDQQPGRDACKGWDIVHTVPVSRFGITPRMAARYMKLNAHLMFPNAPWSVWFDQTHRPVVDLTTLVDYLRLSPIACFKHPQRTTARAEAEACRQLKLDTDEALKGMCRFFDSVDFPDTYGLYGTACVVREHSPAMASFNSLWWWACQRYTQRDQVILPWVCWTLGIVPACLPGLPRSPDADKGQPSRPNPYFEVTVW